MASVKLEMGMFKTLFHSWHGFNQTKINKSPKNQELYTNQEISKNEELYTNQEVSKKSRIKKN